MGTEISNNEFSKSDYEQFKLRLHENLKALKILLDRPGFGDGELSFGAELELYLIDSQGKPLPINQEIEHKLQDPQVTLELNRFNLEYNFSPSLCKNGCLSLTQSEALSAIGRINQAARQWKGSTVPIGILPTLQREDVGFHAMTRLPRYEALTNELITIRGGPFSIEIKGQETLKLEMEDVTLEGANTSFQIHLKVPVPEFADFYNAVQLVTPLVQALAVNSPILFGKRLWHETRVPLFKQSIDCRPENKLHPVPARVNFGNSWLREGAFELFAESVYLYQPILPVCSEQDPLAEIKAGRTPSLDELRLQQGTIWLWNRPVYDPVDGGHLRIEMRSLPAGPSVVDMLANAALFIGLAKLMQPLMRQLLPAIPFAYCLANFYRAAEKGLQAELFWPSSTQNQPQYHKVTDILEKLLPDVGEQLSLMGFPENDYRPFLSVIEERLALKRSGAQWQLDKFDELSRQLPKHEALLAMLLQYQENSSKNLPVARWK